MRRSEQKAGAGAGQRHRRFPARHAAAQHLRPSELCVGAHRLLKPPFQHRRLPCRHLDNRVSQISKFLIPRILLLVRTKPNANSDAIVTSLAQTFKVRPLEVRELKRELKKVGGDMFIFLALENMRIYLVGGVLLALIAILAIALTNYLEDRRTLGLLRVRGVSPASAISIFRFEPAGAGAVGSCRRLARRVGRRVRPDQFDLEPARTQISRAFAADPSGHLRLGPSGSVWDCLPWSWPSRCCLVYGCFGVRRGQHDGCLKPFKVQSSMFKVRSEGG